MACHDHKVRSGIRDRLEQGWIQINGRIVAGDGVRAGGNATCGPFFLCKRVEFRCELLWRVGHRSGRVRRHGNIGHARTIKLGNIRGTFERPVQSPDMGKIDRDHDVFKHNFSPFFLARGAMGRKPAQGRVSPDARARFTCIGLLVGQWSQPSDENA